jgi:hypothetical protein
MAGNEWKLRVRKIAVTDVKIRPADGASFDPQHQLARSRHGISALYQTQGGPDPFQNHRLHQLLLISQTGALLKTRQSAWTRVKDTSCPFSFAVSLRDDGPD